ncbi:hypothetical protein B4U80_12894 [Leptotrombidium deliense]|uniref:Receptor ligand binding region domain-containing protein n=1 Tax=Leptotrombidium deliense TaxID=299467 RepID=A0A443SHV7_9ACAR|nr:hypothetical protein B4U80_12894 [Leptotrombidium deliense]
MKWHQIQHVSLGHSEAYEFIAEMIKSHIQTNTMHSFESLSLYERLLSQSCDQIAQALITNSNTSVIVLMLNGIYDKCILESVYKKSLKTKFHWISVSFNQTSNFTGVETTANGLLSLNYQAKSNITEIFSDHVKSINVEGNTRNPLFYDYFIKRFCHITGNSSDSVQLCTDDKISEFRFLVFNDLYVDVINAVYAYAFAFKDVFTQTCGPSGTLCEKAQNVSADEFFHKYLMNVVFSDITGKQKFAFHNKERKFFVDIEQFRNQGGKFASIKVGDYIDSTLNFHKNLCFENFTSSCYPTCKNGYRKIGNPQNICCWICEKCGNNDIVVNDTECSSCKLGEIPNKNQTICQAVNLTYILENLSSTLLRVEEKLTNIESRMNTLEKDVFDIRLAQLYSGRNNLKGK